jgi:lipid A ethanolaminephosphotransferase
MFSDKGRSEFDREISNNEENLLDIAARAGYSVHWIDNGNGCKGICARVDSRDVHHADVESICPSGECYDEILVHELGKLLSNVTDDTLIVLHQLGSHGPAYYRRYPEAFRAYLPDCRSPNLGDCSVEEIVNSYDNTIRYTDHVVSAAIDVLEDYSDRVDSSLIYVSDHGESVGEHDLYLHGMPYQFAPSEQTDVPMITWVGAAGLGQRPGLSPDCVGRTLQLPVSHDNLFHTELGLLGIATTVYNPELDIYASCRRQDQIAAALAVTASTPATL